MEMASGNAFTVVEVLTLQLLRIKTWDSLESKSQEIPATQQMSTPV